MAAVTTTPSKKGKTTRRQAAEIRGGGGEGGGGRARGRMWGEMAGVGGEAGSCGGLVRGEGGRGAADRGGWTAAARRKMGCRRRPGVSPRGCGARTTCWAETEAAQDGGEEGDKSRGGERVSWASVTRGVVESFVSSGRLTRAPGPGSGVLTVLIITTLFPPSSGQSKGQISVAATWSDRVLFFCVSVRTTRSSRAS